VNNNSKDQNQRELLMRTNTIIIISLSSSKKDRNNISLIDEHTDEINIIIHFNQNNSRKSCKIIVYIIVSKNINNNVHQVID